MKLHSSRRPSTLCAKRLSPSKPHNLLTQPGTPPRKRMNDKCRPKRVQDEIAVTAPECSELKCTEPPKCQIHSSHDTTRVFELRTSIVGI